MEKKTTTIAMFEDMQIKYLPYNFLENKWLFLRVMYILFLAFQGKLPVIHIGGRDELLILTQCVNISAKRGNRIHRNRK